LQLECLLVVSLVNCRVDMWKCRTSHGLQATTLDVIPTANHPATSTPPSGISHTSTTFRTTPSVVIASTSVVIHQTVNTGCCV